MAEVPINELATEAPLIIRPHFFSQSYRDHRDLHSFPTRRSSDLGHRVGGFGQHIDRLVVFALHGLEFDLEKAFELRSEEHTSELQSHSDLVCRLLLEKKNTTRAPALHSSTSISFPIRVGQAFTVA